MASKSTEEAVDTSGLRERNVPHRTQTAEMAKKTVQELNVEEYESEKDFEEKRTFGRTPDGVSKLPHMLAFYEPVQHQMKGLKQGEFTF